MYIYKCRCIFINVGIYRCRYGCRYVRKEVPMFPCQCAGPLPGLRGTSSLRHGRDRGRPRLPFTIQVPATPGNMFVTTVLSPYPPPPMVFWSWMNTRRLQQQQQQLQQQLLLLIILLLLLTGSCVRAGDRYLLAGQSNAVGHTTDATFSFAPTLFSDFVQLIREASPNNPQNRTQSREEIRQQIQELYTEKAKYREKPLPDDEIAMEAESISHAVMNLYDRKLLTEETLLQSVPHAFCTYRYGDRERPEDNVKTGGVAQPTPIRYDSGCGFSFGHEFFFARSLIEQGYYYADNRTDSQASMTVDKVAVSGTSLFQHWFPGTGKFWPQIAQTIVSIPKQDTWKGIIWHQGSQEEWTETDDTSLTYRGNLTTWIQHVRERMCATNPTCHDKGLHIPVIIVQVGFWPSGTRMDHVRSAQASVAASDPYAGLVTTLDLGRHYHYDALSFLVMGDRIAQEMVRLWQGTTTSKSATRSPTKNSTALALLPILGIMVLFPFFFVLYRCMTEQHDYTDYDAIEMEEFGKEDEDDDEPMVLKDDISEDEGESHQEVV